MVAQGFSLLGLVREVASRHMDPIVKSGRQLPPGPAEEGQVVRQTSPPFHMQLQVRKILSKLAHNF